jgi:MFS family permease
LINLNFILNLKKQTKFKKPYKLAKIAYLNRIRFAVSSFYFAMGFTFASWASRIPDIKTELHLSEGDLGKLLFVLPLGQLLIMPFSGKLVTRFGSYRIALVALLFYVLSLTNLGFVTEIWQLALGLLLFGLFGNLCNIAINTQGVHTETLLGKTIMASFHGVWSFAGFSGALFALLMVFFKLSTTHHFLFVLGIIILIATFNYKYLIRVKEKSAAKSEKLFSRPDSSLIWLGIISFCCMASEGIMFDWSGVYFKEIIKVQPSLVILGYTSFMIMMASGRFLADNLIEKIGMKRLLQVSGVLISGGLYLAVLFPYIIPATIAFMIVGLGVSSVVPAVYSLAGKNKTVSPSQALTVVSSISFFGFLVGPPVIGFISELSSLRWSFAFIGIFGILIVFMVSKVKNLN